VSADEDEEEIILPLQGCTSALPSNKRERGAHVGMRTCEKMPTLVRAHSRRGTSPNLDLSVYFQFFCMERR